MLNKALPAILLLFMCHVANASAARAEELADAFFKPLKESYRPQSVDRAFEQVNSQRDAKAKIELLGQLSENGAVSTTDLLSTETRLEGKLFRQKFRVKFTSGKEKVLVLEFYKNSVETVELKNVSLD